MNERIKELAAQASQYASRETTDLDEWEFIFRKKFAQLIAEDCAKMLDEDSYIMPELGGYAHDIRTRYGVQE
jgi:hypothetical protein